MEQKVAPSYAGVCTSCMYAYDAEHRRIRVLSEDQFVQFKCRGLCLTCKTVKAKVADGRYLGCDDETKGGVS